MKENDFTFVDLLLFIGLFAILATICGIHGYVNGRADERHKWQIECVDRGYAEMRKVNGKLELVWIDD